MENNQQVKTLAQLKPQVGNEIIGFGTEGGYNLLQKVARDFSRSAFVPDSYKGEQGFASCVVAVDMAIRLKAAPLMVMQNLYLVNGKPGWSAQWIIGQINNCGRFSPLEYDIEDLGLEEMVYKELYWENKQKLYRDIKVKLNNVTCIAFATELRTGKRIEGVKVTLKMAVQEGWYLKDGSKWKTMPELMLRYRAASFFGKLYAPELLMGLQTAEELHDIIDIDNNGNIESVQTENLKRRKPKDVTPKSNESEDNASRLNSQFTTEEINEADNLIVEIKELRKLKDEALKAKFNQEAIDTIDKALAGGFNGYSLQKIKEQKDFFAKL